jgi:hypothetical protein
MGGTCDDANFSSDPSSFSRKSSFGSQISKFKFLQLKKLYFKSCLFKKKMPSSRKKRVRVAPTEILNLRDLPNYVPPPEEELRALRPASSSTGSSSSSSRNHPDESNDFIDMLLQEAQETHEQIGISLKKMLQKFPPWKTLTNPRMSWKWRFVKKYTEIFQTMRHLCRAPNLMRQGLNHKSLHKSPTDERVNASFDLEINLFV